MLLGIELLVIGLLSQRSNHLAEPQIQALVAEQPARLSDSAVVPNAISPAYAYPVTAPWLARQEVLVKEQEIRLLTQQARTAAAIAREQQQRQRALVGVAWLLALGLLAAAVFYWRLRRHQTLLAKAHREISAAVAEKEVLVQEIHHRVKNNLQLVSSLLAWQGSRSTDPAVVEVLNGSQARIRSMSLVHELLYRAGNLAQVRLDTYLAELLQSIHLSLGSAHQPIKLTAELDAVVMHAKDASAFGLLVNELVTNAYKHAFGPGAGGLLHITLGKQTCPQGFQLRVLDNGVVLPDCGFVGKPESLGIQLVSSLAKQLKATVTAAAHHPTGTCIEVSRA